MKEAAQIVRETVPNYAYVSDFVKSVRRSPLEVSQLSLQKYIEQVQTHLQEV